MKDTKKGIGPYDAIAVMGIDRSPFQLFLEKVGEVEPQKGENEAVYWGQRMKDKIADEFVTRTGLQIKKVDLFHRHPEHSFMIGVGSYIINDDGNKGILDIRTVSEYKRKEWDHNKIPMDAYIRAHHNMAVFSHQIGAVAVLIGGNTFTHRIIERNQVMIDELMKAEKVFWHHVETNTTPEIDGSRAAENYLSSLYPNVDDEVEIKLPKQALKLIEEYRQAKHDEDLAVEAKRAATNKLKALIGSNTIGLIGTKAVTWKPVTQRRLDTKRLKEEYPEIFEQFSKETTYRRFQIK